MKNVLLECSETQAQQAGANPVALGFQILFDVAKLLKGGENTVHIARKQIGSPR
jgi:hypothetical protein